MSTFFHRQIEFDVLRKTPKAVLIKVYKTISSVNILKTTLKLMLRLSCQSPSSDSVVLEYV